MEDTIFSKDKVHKVDIPSLKIYQWRPFCHIDQLPVKSMKMV